MSAKDVTCRICKFEHDEKLTATASQTVADKGAVGALANATQMGYIAGLVESKMVAEKVVDSLCEKHHGIVVLYTVASLKLMEKIAGGGRDASGMAKEVVDEIYGALAPRKEDLS